MNNNHLGFFTGHRVKACVRTGVDTTIITGVVEPYGRDNFSIVSDGKSFVGDVFKNYDVIELLDVSGLPNRFRYEDKDALKNEDDSYKVVVYAGKEKRPKQVATLTYSEAKAYLMQIANTPYREFRYP